MDIRIGSTLEGPAGQTITIESLIGRGGFGQVFAGNLTDGRRVAVKTVLTAVLDDAELAVLQNESRLAVGIDHPNVVRVVHVHDGVGTPAVPPYIVMEFVDGGSLRTALDAHKGKGSRFAPDELRAMFLQVAEGMQAVNARLVHRDLKPDNVLVDAANRRLKIADFGLAKLAAAATRSETFKGWGTRPYQAPEAFDGGPNTAAMDMYAAGVMFFEMAALQWPVQPRAGDNSPLAWRNAHLLTPATDLRKLRADLPPDLIQLIMQMLQKNAAKRPASWGEVIGRLSATGPAPGAPDVSALVQKATTSFIRASEAEALARAEREREAERRALLEQAFAEPLDVVRTLVEAFNASSHVGRLELRTGGPLAGEVRVQGGHSRLVIEAQIARDIDTRSDGVARILGMIRIEPMPQPTTPQEAHNPNSFGSFNLVYRVKKPDDRYGEWVQLRFENNPLVARSTYPHWFAVDLSDLPRELSALRAMGIYQHELRPLDAHWLKELLLQIL